MRLNRSTVRSGCSAALLLALLLAPAATLEAGKGKKKAKPAAEESKPAEKSLEETIAGTHKQEGLLPFYHSRDKLFMELPRGLEDQPLGFAVVMVQAAGDFFMRGAPIDSRVVRWKRTGNHLSLVKENLDFRAAPRSKMAQVLEDSFPDSPVFVGKLLPLSDTPAPMLIDALKLFGPDLAQILPESSGFSIRADDAVLVSIKSFDDNVVARVSYKAKRGSSAPGDGDGGGFARFTRPGRLPDARSAEIVVDYNFYRLPDDGFEPRFADERIGGMTMAYKNYDDVDSSDTLFRHMLRRWDLRKADPDAELSEPVEPITFYLDRSVPDKWRDLVREGVLWWNPAFEKIGFKNAVQVLDAPDDPEWHPADIRHSAIYWNISDNLVFSGVAGPVFVDPRTGEVVKANVHLNGEFFSYALNRYLVYAWWRAPEPGWEEAALEVRREAIAALQGDAGHCDRAASFSSQIAFARLVLLGRGVIEPGTDEADRFAREAFLELVAHEVGHALGFPHNWKASLVSNWEDVRTGNVDGRNGPRIFSSSVMDYNPIYLAPKGTPQGDYFMRELGAYDYLSVEYIYRPFDGKSPAERSAALDAIARRAETEPGLIFDSGVLGGIDPTTNSDDIGDDPLAFAESRLVMLQQEVLPRLPELVLAEGHDYSLLRQALDSAIFSVAMDYIDMTARHVGGQILLRRIPGTGGAPPITPVAAETQRRALDVLDRYIFDDTAFALSPETLRLLKADLLYDWNYSWRFASDYNVGNRIAGLYGAALSTLLEPARLARILDNERRVAADGDRFTLPELFQHLEQTAFGDLSAPSADRRALQRMLVGRLADLVLEPESGTPAEAGQLAASSLRSLRKRIGGALEVEDLDGYTRAHFEDLSSRARRTLDASIRLPSSR